jgi:hypothetical protein
LQLLTGKAQTFVVFWAIAPEFVGAWLPPAEAGGKTRNSILYFLKPQVKQVFFVKLF